MLLCLDVGNSQLSGALFRENSLLVNFCHTSLGSNSADQFGVFINDVLSLNGIKADQVNAIAISSVVPTLDYPLKLMCERYFRLIPFMVTYANLLKLNFSIEIFNPSELGSDIIASSIAALEFYDNCNLIVVDLGTVTTIAAIDHKRKYLGTVLMPGVYTTMYSMGQYAAKLFAAEITRPQTILGRSTTESMQAGVFFGHLGAIREVVSRLTQELFLNSTPIVVATGGYVQLFGQNKLFDHVEPNLVLHGIKIIYESSQ